MLAWRIHEIPAHKADHKAMRQAELVSALTLLGLFQHWVWAIALFIAYMDWQATEDWIVGILRKSRWPEPAVAAVSQGLTSAAESTAMEAPPPRAEAVPPASAPPATGSGGEKQA